MDGVYCCETCPDEEINDTNTGSMISGVKDDVDVKDSSDNIVLDNSSNQLMTAIEKTEQLVSSRKESLVGIRKMMFENIASKKDVSKLTDDDKVVIKTRKRSLDDKFHNDNGDKSVDKSSIKSDKIISCSSVDSNVELIVNKLSDYSLEAGDDDSVKNIIVNNDEVTNKLSDIISDKNHHSDLTFIDSDCEDSRDNGKSVYLITDSKASDEDLQGVASELNKSSVLEFVEPENEKEAGLSKEVVELPEEMIEGNTVSPGKEDTYLEMKSLSIFDVITELNEPIYEEITESNKTSDSSNVMDVRHDNKEKTDFAVTDSVEESKITEDVNSVDTVGKCEQVVKENRLPSDSDMNEDEVPSDDEFKNIKVEDESSSLQNRIEPAIVLPEENDKNFESGSNIIVNKEKQKDSIDYPTELNPFGDEDEDVDADLKNQTASTNPFESDMEDDEEEIKSNKVSATVHAPVPAARKTKSYSENLNPFWSGSEEEEDEGSENTSLLSPPVPLPRKLKTPQMSPTPIPRSSHHKKSPSVGSRSSFGIPESPSPLKKKSPAPAPPSHSSTLRKRKAKPAPPPPIFVYSSRSPTPSVCSDVSAPVTPTMQNKIEKDTSNRQKQFTDGTFLKNKSTFGQWKRKKGQAPPPPLPQRRTVKPMPLKQVRQELADIEIKQQELERQGVALEQTIRDKFDHESSMTPYVEELVLQLFELVNEKNELFRRQAELMYLRRQHNLEEEHAELEYQIRCLMLCPEHNKTDSDKEREEELIKRLIDVVERRNAIVQCLEMDRLREAEEDRSVNTQLGNFSAAIGSEIDLTNIDKKEKKFKKDKKKEKDTSTTSLDRDIDSTDKMHKYKKLKKKWFTLQHQKKH